MVPRAVLDSPALAPLSVLMWEAEPTPHMLQGGVDQDPLPGPTGVRLCNQGFHQTGPFPTLPKNGNGEFHRPFH